MNKHLLEYLYKNKYYYYVPLKEVNARGLTLPMIPVTELKCKILNYKISGKLIFTEQRVYL